MNLYNLLLKRRSCRSFKSQKIEEEKINLLLNGALLSPTSKNNRPWEFICIDNEEILEKLSTSKPHGANFLKDAPLCVAVIADPSVSDVWVEDDSIASIIIQLMAEDIGLGSCWIQIRNRNYDDQISASSYIKQILKIPDNFEVLSLIALGYKAKERAPYEEEQLLTNRIHINTF